MKLRLLSKAALLKRFVFCTTEQEMRLQVVVSVVVIGTVASAIVTYYDFNQQQFVYVPIVRLLRLDNPEECATLHARLTMAISASASVRPKVLGKATQEQADMLRELRVPFSNWDGIDAEAGARKRSSRASRNSSGSRRKGHKSSRRRSRHAGAASESHNSHGGDSAPGSTLGTVFRSASMIQQHCTALLPGCTVDKVMARVCSPLALLLRSHIVLESLV